MARSAASSRACAFFARGSPAWPRRRLASKVLELLLVLLADVERVGAQRILHAPLRVLDPARDLRRRQVERTAGFGHRCFALDDPDDERGFALRRPTFYAVVHRHTHCHVLLCSMSSYSVGHYKGTLFSSAHFRMARLVSSVPLSLTMQPGLP